ncbi:MAG: succinylglutamate desuccinylase/aspartoacylase family protein [Thermoguttaceae bacterium]|nr:succinylglutamate desuccinylase/aspartoacylase family protein [Thermoguttaceae bacterium]
MLRPRMFLAISLVGWLGTLVGHLASADEVPQLTFFAWSDQHVATNGDGSHLVAAIDAMNALPGRAWPEAVGGTVAVPAFVFGCGDITEWPTVAARDTYNELITRRLKWPSFDILGNHDEGGKSPSNTLKNWIIARHGAISYTFDRGGVHFIALYSAYDETLNNPAQPIHRDALDFLRRDVAQVAKGTPVIVALHLCFDAITNRDDLVDALGDANVIMVLSGHYHKPSVHQYRGINFVQAPSPAPNGTPEVTVVRVTPDRVLAIPYDYRRAKWSENPRHILVAPISRQPTSFDFPGISFDRDFAGAKLDACRQAETSPVVGGQADAGPAENTESSPSIPEYIAISRAENTPINDSAWYAFKIVADAPRRITVALRYEGGSHRYAPKISRDGQQWTPLPAAACEVSPDRSQARLQLDVGPEPLWVAAQELITRDDIAAWSEQIAAQTEGHRTPIGQSREGRPIFKLEIGNQEAAEAVFIIGRQHPPEVTGTLGLMRFIETIAGNDRLARQFRQRFLTTVVPLVNPDGVERGYWRHSTGGIDLNRDWDEFSQPETRAVRDAMLDYQAAGSPQLRLFLDFHSTHHDVFYTSPEDDTPGEGFTSQWLGAIGDRFPDYQVRREETPLASSKPTSMRWVYRTFDVPSITYEWGDGTPREQIARLARGAAEEMMRLLLAVVPADAEPSLSGAER